MSHASSTSRSDVSRSVEALLGLGPQLLKMSLESTFAFMRDAADVVRPAIPPGVVSAVRAGVPRRSSCDIPETECPPRCVHLISWRAVAGEAVRYRIRVTNSSNVARRFHVVATPFGDTGGKGTIKVAPENFELAPRGSQDVEASFAVGAEMGPGRYEAEVLVRGSWEQCVLVRLDVQDERQCVCEVVQGDPPVRIRAHRWYDHFQCVEPCDPRHTSVHEHGGELPPR